VSALSSILDGATQMQVLADCRRGLETLLAHKLRSLLTMLGMIFGVAAVVSMMSIGAGAREESLRFIEQLGVRNLIVEAREAPEHDRGNERQQAHRASRETTNACHESGACFPRSGNETATRGFPSVSAPTDRPRH